MSTDARRSTSLWAPRISATSGSRRGRRRGLPWWQVAVAGAAVGAAVAAVWVTLRADFLAHPGWLAAQKADFVLGPVFIGLYWMRRRPRSRFGPMLIAFGFVGAVYVLQSSSTPWLFSVGLLWENVIGLATYVLILAFPTGRLDGAAARIVLLVAVLAAILPATVILLVLPQVGAGGSISGCRALCPENTLAITSDAGLALDLFAGFRYAVIAVALAIGALLVWRLVTGTPPQRRALAIGAPIALLFLAFQIAFQVLGLVRADDTKVYAVVIWGFVAARAVLWYGFLVALIAAQLFAARALQRLVVRSLRRPSRDDLEEMLREPLGDPHLRLMFADPRTGTWDGEQSGTAAEPPGSPPGREVTVVEREGAPAVAIFHDPQLDDDPELLEAAGAVALLAAENAELDTAWADALEELQRSRARLIRAADDERRKFERNLHDGVQQQLISIRVRLGLTEEAAGLDSETQTRLGEIADSVEATLDEVRDIGHGLYPPMLTELGLVSALEQVRRHAATPLVIRAVDIGRYSPDIESAVYYCCREAIQNATKHGGPAVQISVTLRQDADGLRFEVSDDGPGFQREQAMGTGLQNMQDRLGAVAGRLSIATEPGHGTTVSGFVPLQARHGEASRLPGAAPG